MNWRIMKGARLRTLNCIWINQTTNWVTSICGSLFYTAVGLVFIVVLFIFCSYVLLLVVFCFLLFEMVIPNSYSIFNSIAIFHCFPSLLYQKTDFVFFNRFLFQPTFSFSRLNVLFQLSPSMHLQLNFWPAPIWL